MATCKGRKKAGSSCRSSIVLGNGYCRAHQDQVQEKRVRWTRKRLKATITAHGGSEGLALADADLSDLDPREMDLHGIVLIRWERESGTWIAANLQEANLENANLQGANRGAPTCGEPICEGMT